MLGIGVWEWVMIFLVILVVFGPKSLPKIGQALGKGIREFKDATRGLTQEFDDEPEPRRPLTPQPPVVTSAVTPPPPVEETDTADKNTSVNQG